MTNKDRIFSLLAFGPTNINSLDGEIIDQGIDPDAIYDGSTKLPCVKAAIKLMELLLTTADITNSIDGNVQMAVKYDRDAVLARINLLKGEYGLTDESKPFIRAPKVW